MFIPTEGVSDIGIVLVDDKEKTTVNDIEKDISIDFNDNDFDSKTTNHKLDILVENQGRNDGGTDNLRMQRKGLNGDVIVDSQKVNKFEVFSLDFKDGFAKKATAMKGRPYQSGHKQQSPMLYRAELDIKGEPKDTFIRTDNWKKGIVLVNDFNIGRYFDVGPQKTLYLPAPLLKTGKNDILIFELHSSSDKIKSVATPDLG